MPQIICNVYRDKHMINQRMFGFLHIKISRDIEVPSKASPKTNGHQESARRDPAGSVSAGPEVPSAAATSSAPPAVWRCR